MKNVQTFSITELVKNTGYKDSTIETYLRKKLLNFLVEQTEGKYHTTDRFRLMSLDDFVDHMNQTSRKCRR